MRPALSTKRNLVATALLGMLLVGGCGGGSDDSGDAGGDSAGQVKRDGRSEGESDPLAPAPEEGGAYDFDSFRGDGAVGSALSAEAGSQHESVDAPREASELLEEAAIISKAVVSAKADDVARARFEAMKVMDNYQGELAADESTTGDDGEMETARLIMRIPSEDYEAAYADLQEVGESVDSRSGSEDVTTEVIDVEARIRAQEQSLARIEALLAQAQRLRTIIAIESQLSRRQADLDSLKSRQAYLEDQTSMATITMHIERTPEKEKQEKDDDDKGFVAGLSNGWDGLVAATVGIATVIGVLLPFAVVLALIGVPLLVLIRRLRPVRPVVEDQPSA